MVVPVDPEPEEPQVGYLDDAIGKPIVWNQGWDTNIGNRTRIDPSVQISFRGFVFADFGPIHQSAGPRMQVFVIGVSKPILTPQIIVFMQKV